MFTASAFFVNSGEGFGVVLACTEFPFSEIDAYHSCGIVLQVIFFKIEAAKKGYVLVITLNIFEE